MSGFIRDFTGWSSLLFLLGCGNIAGPAEPSLGEADHALQHASAPLIEKFHEDVTLTLVSCGSFDVIRHLVADIIVKTFLDHQGNPVRVAIHVSEKNTLTNSATGQHVAYPGILNISIDLPSGTERVTGTPIHITVPHEGNFVFDAGILILDQAGNTIFEGGPHAFGPTGDPSIFCSLLSGATGALVGLAERSPAGR